MKSQVGVMLQCCTWEWFLRDSPGWRISPFVAWWSWLTFCHRYFFSWGRLNWICWRLDYIKKPDEEGLEPPLRLIATAGSTCFPTRDAGWLFNLVAEDEDAAYSPLSSWTILEYPKSFANSTGLKPSLFSLCRISRLNLKIFAKMNQHVTCCMLIFRKCTISNGWLPQKLF